MALFIECTEVDSTGMELTPFPFESCENSLPDGVGCGMLW
jgi:hypothetical protein